MNPPQVPLEYDDQLLASCATSASILFGVRDAASAARGGWNEENEEALTKNEVVEEAEAAEGAVGSMGSMGLEGAVGSKGRNDAGGVGRVEGVEGALACRTLFEQHARHYQRPLLSEEEGKFWDAWTSSLPMDPNDPIGLSGPSGRIEAFLRSAVFVNEHNRDDGIHNSSGRKRHRVALNRFSDLLPHELPLMSDTSSSSSSSTPVSTLSLSEDAGLSHLSDHPYLSDLSGLSDSLPSSSDAMVESLLRMNQISQSNQRLQNQNGDAPIFLELNSEEIIKELGDRIQQKRQRQQQHQYQKQQEQQQQHMEQRKLQQQQHGEGHPLRSNNRQRNEQQQYHPQEVLQPQQPQQSQQPQPQQQQQQITNTMENIHMKLIPNTLFANIFQTIRERWWWIGGGHGNNSSNSNNNINNNHNSINDATQQPQQSTKSTKQHQNDHNSKEDDRRSSSGSSSSSSHHHSHNSRNNHNSHKKEENFLLDKENELGGLQDEKHLEDVIEEDKGDEDEVRGGTSIGNEDAKGANANSDDEEDEWASYLNWATEDNPDGVSIVHEVMDQGLCGSCWAVAALGSLEASISRNMAYIAYEEAYSSISSSHGHGNNGNSNGSNHDNSNNGSNQDSSSSHRTNESNDDQTKRTTAILTAQQIERQSISLADLSVQELVDCDTHYDQGCSGGNPLLAFYFLHRFGVTSTLNYPYIGGQGTCRYKKVDQPIATVETWGILTPDHENNMEKVLRYIGPVAVGLNGADPAFLGYEGGVFRGGKMKDASKCELGVADHAMLIVGYGEEIEKDGTKTKYWIARNSWGKDWGEKGYVRMERTDGKKGHRGVCGIARSPSVALGGMFTKDVILSVGDQVVENNNDNDVHDDDKDGGKHKNSHSGSSSSGSISRPNLSHASSEIHSLLHRIRSRLGFSQKGIMMSTINGSEENESDRMLLPYAAFTGIMVFFLVLAYFHKKRQSRQSSRTGNQRSEGGNQRGRARYQSSFGGESFSESFADSIATCYSSDDKNHPAIVAIREERGRWGTDSSAYDTNACEETALLRRGDGTCYYT